MYFKFNSWDKAYKEPFGAIKTNTQLMLRVTSDADTVIVHGFDNDYTMEKNNDEFTIHITPDIEFGLIFYTFEVIYNGHSHFYGKGQRGAEAVENGVGYQLTIHNNAKSPDWFKGKVMYQIYIDRFFKTSSNDTQVRGNSLLHTSWDEKPVYIKDGQGRIVLWDFFGGNLDGVIEKLDYLKDLGIDIIYLNPIFESSSNHKYDTADYNSIDMMYGTDETLKHLVDEAQKKDMKVMLDGVFSHTGDDSIYFNKYGNYGDDGAYRNENSQYRSWYKFKSYPDEYDCWWGVTSLPCVNELEPSYMDYLLNEENGAVTKWMKLGIAGWRLDVADELPDEFISKLKQAVREVNPEAILLGEVWEDASNKVSYDKRRDYIVNDSLNSVSNYPLRDDLIKILTNNISIDDFANNYMTLQENYPQDVFLSLMNMTGTHDSTRLFTLLGDAPHHDSMDTWTKREYRLSDEKRSIAIKRLKMYYFMLYTLPGNPCIYYGDEICLEGYKDPYNRGTYNWDSGEKDIINLIKELSILRNELDTKNGFVSISTGNGLLKYQVVSDEKIYKVYVNVSEDMIILDCGDNTLPKYQLNAHKENTQIIINKLGAVVI